MKRITVQLTEAEAEYIQSLLIDEAETTRDLIAQWTDDDDPRTQHTAQLIKIKTLYYKLREAQTRKFRTITPHTKG